MNKSKPEFKNQSRSRSNAFFCIQKAPEIFEDSYIEKKNKESNLNLSLDLEEIHASIDRGETPKELKFSYGGEENDDLLSK